MRPRRKRRTMSFGMTSCPVLVCGSSPPASAAMSSSIARVRSRRYTIGLHGVWTPETARQDRTFLESQAAFDVNHGDTQRAAIGSARCCSSSPASASSTLPRPSAWQRHRPRPCRPPAHRHRSRYRERRSAPWRSDRRGWLSCSATRRMAIVFVPTSSSGRFAVRPVRKW